MRMSETGQRSPAAGVMVIGGSKERDKEHD
jgi:hypothetical protein